jgi:chromosome segregation ATPase
MWEEWLAEAADELDQLTGSKAALQTEIDRLRSLCDSISDDAERHLKEIERLREILDGTERREAEYLALIEKKHEQIERLLIERNERFKLLQERNDEIERLSRENERLEHNQITASHTAIAQAAAIQAQHASASMREADAQMQRADALDAKCTQFTEALLKAMTLIDELLRENVRLCSASNEPPNVKLFTAKNLFDAAMHKLLGEGD